MVQFYIVYVVLGLARATTHVAHATMTHVVSRSVC